MTAPATPEFVDGWRTGLGVAALAVDTIATALGDLFGVAHPPRADSDPVLMSTEHMAAILGGIASGLRTISAASTSPQEGLTQ